MSRGPAGALLDREEVTCEVIADGVHLHDTVIRLAARAAGPGRLVLITDAMAAAGMPDGNYRLGSMRVDVAGGVVRLAGSGESGAAGASAGTVGASAGTVGASAGTVGASAGTVGASAGTVGAIAGSTATMADVVRHAVAAGLPVTTVAAAASTTPARVLGLGDRTGALRAGLDADLVVCDEEFRLRAVMRQGEWVAGTPKGGISSPRAPNQ